jgi:nanoRNase/pAp phosphatase (c-di-AMP/oligoRNAs hydrolase)
MDQPSKPGSFPVAPSSHPAPKRGGAPVQRLREVLEAAWRRAGTGAPRRVLVLTHRGPDPDALGACEGIRLLCREGFGFDAEVATVGRIHRAENLAMVRALGIELAEYSTLDPARFCGGLLVDTQPEFGHTVVPEDVPILAVFDHHVPPDRPGEVQREIPHKDVRLGMGATSSIVYEYLRDAGVPLDEHSASALFCGVRYDTADLSRNASALDEEAYYETFRHCDRRAIAEINNPPLPRDYFAELSRALSVARQHGPLVIALLGAVKNPEFVAEMADLVLRMKGVSWVVVGGAFEGTYVLSLRTDYAFGNAYPLMARVLDGRGSFGGHGHIAGARIDLEDEGESAIASVERALRQNALAILGPSEDGETIPPEGRALA